MTRNKYPLSFSDGVGDRSLDCSCIRRDDTRDDNRYPNISRPHNCESTLYQDFSRIAECFVSKRSKLYLSLDSDNIMLEDTFASKDDALS